MLVAYPALFYYDASDQAEYFVTFPDFENSATQGKNIQNALEMASEYLGIIVADLIDTQSQVPRPSDINILDLKENDPFKNDDDFQLEYDPEKSFITMVYVDINNYLGSQNPVKKTLTIPKWADDLGKKHSLNFSKTLEDAIVEKVNH
ncbi:type II toxin-antitoxin system HicB family antitoxin [Tetragenococcus halophilus]|uniref:Type II toxin-antitoxin system HicB family antitoxin n=1 Tax=Tetragenococcus halophilus TaxID=51669 RepID=A0AB35HMT5_TETHA|nr:type II toxin-antitoxin system HicB family antitoxin [Tetragenococcus halophilus]MCO8297420.1 type II toxin-antitoxin system HicB family antitoxin [Tetragenococcus halophilus]